MSCAEIMYQPYSPYFPYQRPAAAAVAAAASTPTAATSPVTLTAAQPPIHHTQLSKKYGMPKMNDVLEPSASASGSDYGTTAARTSSDCAVGHASSDGDKNRGVSASAAEAQYLSANCVVFTYYTGDLASVVDEHFTRALSQPSSYSPDTDRGSGVKDSPPMSQRNFPPSFWNCNYQPSTTGLGAMTATVNHPDIGYATDPYHTGTLHATIHQGDPWHYTLTGHAQSASPYGHRPSVHDLSYTGMSATNRFNSQYGPLLLQPPVRSTRLTPVSAGCAALEKDTWGASRYHEPLAAHNLSHVDTNYGTTYSPMGAMTDPNSGGYMYEFYKLQTVHAPRSYR